MTISICLSLCPSVYPSVQLCICLSICLHTSPRVYKIVSMAILRYGILWSRQQEDNLWTRTSCLGTDHPPVRLLGILLLLLRPGRQEAEGHTLACCTQDWTDSVCSSPARPASKASRSESRRSLCCSSGTLRNPKSETLVTPRPQRRLHGLELRLQAQEILRHAR